MLKEDSLPPSLGDWRPPRVFALAPATGELVDLSPVGDPLLNATIGAPFPPSPLDSIFSPLLRRRWRWRRIGEAAFCSFRQRR